MTHQNAESQNYIATTIWPSADFCNCIYALRVCELQILQLFSMFLVEKLELHGNLLCARVRLWDLYSNQWCGQQTYIYIIDIVRKSFHWK